MTETIANPKTVALASDHAGLDLKTALIPFLKAAGYAVEDLGTHAPEPCDYPDYANALAAWVLKSAGRRGVLVCGSGIGVSMAANRHKGIRAALVRSGLEAELARRHNDANVLCLGSRISGTEVAKDCVTQFLNTQFEGGRHAARVEKME